MTTLRIGPPTVSALALLYITGCFECGAPRGAPPPNDPSSATALASPPAPTPAPTTATAAPAEPPAAPAGEGAPRVAITPGAERDVEGFACLGRRDYACVIRLFSDGRAETARQLAMLIQAERASGAPDQGCGTMTVLLARYPDSPEARRFRMFHQAHCPH
ncbi:MAG: hypothetical protein OHK0013_43210 [Sandaracinaceae bacterium]